MAFLIPTSAAPPGSGRPPSSDACAGRQGSWSSPDSPTLTLLRPRDLDWHLGLSGEKVETRAPLPALRWTWGGDTSLSSVPQRGAGWMVTGTLTWLTH